MDYRVELRTDIDKKVNGHVKFTTHQMRSDVRELIRQTNAILSEGHKQNITNASYFLRDFHIDKKGKIHPNIKVEYMNKRQTLRYYNELRNFIQADTYSTSFEKWRKKSKGDAITKARKTIRERYGKRYSDEDIVNLINLKSKHPELFDRNDLYLDVLNQTRFNRKRDIQSKTLSDLYDDAKYYAQTSGKAYTSDDIVDYVYRRLNMTEKQSLNTGRP